MPNLTRCGVLEPDPSALALVPALIDHGLPLDTYALMVDNTSLNFQPGLYRNNSLPDCTSVGVANAASFVAKLNGYDLIIDRDKVPAFFAECTGSSADNDASMIATKGAQLLTVLRRQMISGFDVGPQRLFGLFGAVGLKRSAMATAMTHLGHTWNGVRLFEREMENPAVWDIVPGRDDGKLIGGHCTVTTDYSGMTDDDVVRVATWGGWQLATWAWIEARTTESYALIWRQLASAAGVNVFVNTETLEAALATGGDHG